MSRCGRDLVKHCFTTRTIGRLLHYCSSNDGIQDSSKIILGRFIHKCFSYNSERQASSFASSKLEVILGQDVVVQVNVLESWHEDLLSKMFDLQWKFDDLTKAIKHLEVKI